MFRHYTTIDYSILLPILHISKVALTICPFSAIFSKRLREIEWDAIALFLQDVIKHLCLPFFDNKSLYLNLESLICEKNSSTKISSPYIDLATQRAVHITSA